MAHIDRGVARREAGLSSLLYFYFSVSSGCNQETHSVFYLVA